MALKDERGKYHRITGMFIQHGKVELQMAKNYDEAERKEEPGEAKYYNEHSIEIPAELLDSIKASMYGLLKDHKVFDKEIKHSAECNEDGEIEKEAWVETIYSYPYADYIDC